MNFLAALLLVWLPREDAAYGALTVLMRARGLRSLYASDLAMLQASASRHACMHETGVWLLQRSLVGRRHAGLACGRACDMLLPVIYCCCPAAVLVHTIHCSQQHCRPVNKPGALRTTRSSAILLCGTCPRMLLGGCSSAVGRAAGAAVAAGETDAGAPCAAHGGLRHAAGALHYFLYPHADKKRANCAVLMSFLIWPCSFVKFRVRWQILLC